MSIVIRRVPKDWQHPKDKNECYIPLFDGNNFYKDIACWDEHNQKWNEGFQTDFEDGWILLSEENKGKTYSSWNGERPNLINYMPIWQDAECTHFMCYENISEGTPVSPIFSTIEETNNWIEITNRSFYNRIK